MSEKIARLDKSVIDMVYPVGAIYMSVNSTNPGNLFGGKWEQIKDRFLLAAGDTYAAGSTGGEAQHTLTIAEMPSHSHTERLGDASNPQNINRLRRAVSGGGIQGVKIDATFSASLGEDITTDFTGDSNPHNNMPPYLTVYMWKRTA